MRVLCLLELQYPLLFFFPLAIFDWSLVTQKRHKPPVSSYQNVWTDSLQEQLTGIGGHFKRKEPSACCSGPSFLLISWQSNIFYDAPCWTIGAVVWFHLTTSCLVLLRTPVALSVFWFFPAYWPILMTLPPTPPLKILQHVSLRGGLLGTAFV